MNHYSFTRQSALRPRHLLPQPAPPPALAFIWQPNLFVRLIISHRQFEQPRGSPRFVNSTCEPPGGAGPPNRKPLFSSQDLSSKSLSNQVVINQDSNFLVVNLLSHFFRRNTMKQIQTHGSSKLKTYGLLAAGLVLGLSSISAWAVGTASGTVVSNQATLGYTVGGVAQTAILSDGDAGTAGVQTTDFRVDNKVNVTVAEADGTFTPVVPGQTGAAVAFNVTNNGNSPSDFSLATTNVTGVLFTGTDNFDPSAACSTFVESGATAGYQPLADTATFIDEMPAAPAVGSSRVVYVVCSIPIAQVNNDNANVSLTATGRGTFTGTNGTYVATPGALGAALSNAAANTQAGVETVFADVAGTDDAIGDAQHSARDQFRVVTATLSVLKSISTVCDPVNGNTGPKNIPLGVVRWTITIANTGGASASLTTIADTLNANTTFDPDLITGAGGAAACEFAAAGAGTAENANGRGFKVSNSVARPMLGAPGGTVTSSFFTTAVDADGLDAVGAAVNAALNTALPAGGTYTAGELKAGETLTIYFNVGIN